MKRYTLFYIPLLLLLALTLLLLTACDPGRHERMEQELLRARKMNKEYVSFTVGGALHSPDSVMREVADYYDSHGTPNEQMEAHYLLGCVYRDLGEAPRAIDCYLDAAACADTTAADCDFYMLASIHAQMAWLYHQQLLLSYEVEAHRKASRYNLLANNTLLALHEQKMVAGVFVIQNKTDSAEITLNDVISQYHLYGYKQEALQASVMLMHIYINMPNRLSELKNLIEKYDTSSILFTQQNDLPSSSRMYFYYKGAYFEKTCQFDSAEYYYRKSYMPGLGAIAREPAYKGLFSVFSKLRKSDSIVKYARLYCEANDSSIAIKDQELTALMAASYNYQHYQAEAMLNAKKSNRNLVGAVISLIAALILLIINVKYKAIKKEKQRQLAIMRSKYDVVKSKYKEKLKELDVQEETHRNIVNSLLEENARKQEELSSLQYENADTQHAIDIINEQFEEHKKKHEAEINSYRAKMEELSRQARLTGERENYRHFLESAIVKRIKIYAERENKKLSENEIASLEETVSEYYPELTCDLSKTTNIKNLDMQVCLLVLLGMGNRKIMQLLNISDKQVSNLKKEANTALFNNNSAKNLYKNLITHYTFISD